MRTLAVAAFAPVSLIFAALAACGGSTASSTPDASSLADAHASGDAKSGGDAKSSSDANVKRPSDAAAESGCGELIGDCANGGHFVCTDSGWRCQGGCTGSTPNCFGNDISQCCGQDPSGTARCVSGAWTCGDAAAPGCNTKSCVLGGDAGSGSPLDAALDGPACGSVSSGNMGETLGSCPGTEQCCPGGAAGSYYCYSGTGPCPSVP